MKSNELSRRNFIILGFEAIAAMIGLTSSAPLARIARAISRMPESDWPTKEDEILKKIEGMEGLSGRELWTTLCFRKMVWEAGVDDSDWMSHKDIIEDRVATLAEVGIKGGRLVIFPFEVTEDGKEFNWEAMDKAIEIMSERGMKIDICAGPLDYPYGPNGVRVPKKSEELLKAEVEKGHGEFRISGTTDTNMSETERSVARDALDYLAEVVLRVVVSGCHRSLVSVQRDHFRSQKLSNR